MEQSLRAELLRALQAIDDRLTAIESRGTPEQWQQAFSDLLAIYGATGQLVEVVRNQHEQLQALTEAYGRQSLSLKEHHESSSGERRDIKELMSAMHLTLGSLISIVRTQVHLSQDIAKAVGADITAAELARLARDARPEEQSDG